MRLSLSPMTNARLSRHASAHPTINPSRDTCPLCLPHFKYAGMSSGDPATLPAVVCGSGSAGMGVVDALRNAMVCHGLSEEEASRRFW